MPSTRKRVREDEFLDDPLHFEIPESELCLTQDRTPWDFTITTDSYISLCSRVYAALCIENSKFAAEIPESAFQCYAIVWLWKRFADLLPGSEINGSPFFDKLGRLNDCYCIVPSPLQKYLDGIGHFRDPHNYDRKFVLPVFPKDEDVGGIPFTFGQVNAKTHYFYEAYPAPGIAVLRMLADMKYTKEPSEKNLLWDLPNELRPYEPELVMQSPYSNALIYSIRPTKNLLGWAPAQTLTNSQLQLLKLVMNNDGLTFPRNALYTQKLFDTLFMKMCEYLQVNQLTMDLIEEEGLVPCPPTSTGSLAQGMVSKKKLDSFEFDRSSLYCEGTIAVCSSYKVNQTLIKGAAVTGFRMPKEPIGNRHCWAAYDFNEYTSVPESWIRTRNSIYTCGMVGGLHETIYSTGYTNKRILQNVSILHSMIKYKKG